MTFCHHLVTIINVDLICSVQIYTCTCILASVLRSQEKCEECKLIEHFDLNRVCFSAKVQVLNTQASVYI